MARKPYRELVGRLNYLAVATRPDIAYAVGRLASLKVLSSIATGKITGRHGATIHVLRYVKGTRSHTLTLGGSTPPSLVGYADSDYANCIETTRSISGHCYSLGSGMIFLSSQKQRHATDSTCYAEYVALHHAGKEAVFLRELLDRVSFPPSTATRLHCDNDVANKLTGDHCNHTNAKHVRVKYHTGTTRDLIDEGLVHINRIASPDNTDIFTKPLTKPHFERFRGMLGLRSP